MKKQRLLIIDDDKDFLQDLTFMVRDDYECVTATNAEKALHAVQAYNPKVILLDLVLGEQENGLDLLKKIHQFDDSIPIIIITDYASVETAVKAIQMGAFDYISKSPNRNELRLIIEKSLKHRSFKLMQDSLKEETGLPFYTMIGESEGMLDVIEKVMLYAKHQSTVLITGESGVGKELVARQIHLHSSNNQAPFIAVNCAAIPKELAESELFGHEKGSFTGADKRKIGKFEMADDGVIFLDEISEISPEVQVKLLRVLQEKEFNRVGGTSTIKTNAKIIAATNRDLSEMVKKGTFREDLFYRLDVLPIHVPPLRERKSDIPKLVQYFVDIICDEMKIPAKKCTSEAMELFQLYDWPGNIRQLRNYITRAVIMSPGSKIDSTHLDPAIKKNVNPVLDDDFVVPKTWEEMDRIRKAEADRASRAVEQRFIEFIMKEYEGNVSKAAEAIGINRTNLHKIIRRVELLDSENN
ncbi:sigma-54-dependent Fis family transcriptional regulator [bacterium]|nr:MAG: sigma-54-dependent Fis family transcriptional regulator [bacterium]